MKPTQTLGLALASLFSYQSMATELCIEVDNIQTLQGTIRTVVVDSKAGFDGEAKPVGAFVVPASQSSLSVCIDGFAEGEYALRVMQDVDGDEELATNLIGAPAEPWGTSNNAKGSFGPPKWKQARFELKGERVIQNITLNN